MATSFGWNEKGKRKKISNANLKILEPRRKQKKKKDKSPAAAAASHRHTRSSILLYARLFFKEEKSLPPPPRPSPRLVVEGVARSFRNEVTFQVAAQHTQAAAAAATATAGIIFLFCFVLSFQKNLSSHLVSLYISLHLFLSTL